MRLRARLAVVLFFTSLPLGIAVWWIDVSFERHEIERSAREAALSFMQSGARQRADNHPEFFPRRPPPEFRRPDHGHHRRRDEAGRPPHLMHFWAYRKDFVSGNAHAPDFPPVLRRELAAGEDSASIIVGDTMLVGVKMPWDEGESAHILVERKLDAVDAETGLLWGIVAMAATMLMAVFIAAGPIVRRIRTLQREVREGQASVSGSDEIADLAASFNQAFEAAADREKALRRFIADTTHDVMLPLTVLQGHLDAIGKGDRGAETIRKAQEEADYMGSLMHNLAAAAKLEGSEQPISSQAFCLRAVVERVASRHTPMANVRGVELAYAIPDEGVMIGGDITLIEQAISNIVHNAVRYNREGGHVSIVVETQNGRFEVRVTDDGPGVSDEQLAKLGERSFRTDEARTRDPDGLGLGMHIAQDVAVRHGFELDFAHVEGGGLEVTLSGPLKPA